MRRRTLLQWAAAFVAARPFLHLRLFAQAPPFTTPDIAALEGIAEVVLPTALGAAARHAEVQRFVRWFVNYHAGADMGHGYGNSRLANRSGPSPAGRYADQFAALESAARARGGASFAALPLADRRAIVFDTLEAPSAAAGGGRGAGRGGGRGGAFAGRLPAHPGGGNLIEDFMGFYFNSPAAYDLCYDARIDRDDCRGLPGSDNAPAPLSGGVP